MRWLLRSRTQGGGNAAVGSWPSVLLPGRPVGRARCSGHAGAFSPGSQCVLLVLVAALIGMVAGCSSSPPPPLATRVCELPAHAQRTVQITASVSVDAEGRTLIGDPQCPATQIELRLSNAAQRAGAAGRLQAAARAAAGGGQSSFAIRLTGVYADGPPEAYFVTDSVAPAP